MDKKQLEDEISQLRDQLQKILAHNQKLIKLNAEMDQRLSRGTAPRHAPAGQAGFVQVGSTRGKSSCADDFPSLYTLTSPCMLCIIESLDFTGMH